MNIGELRDRVTVKTKEITLNDERLVSATYASVGKIWANIVPIGGEVAQQRYGVSEEGITLRMRTRRIASVIIGNRVEYDGDEYEIRHVAKFPDAYVALLRAL